MRNINTIKEQIKKIPILSDLARKLYWRTIGNQTMPTPFPGSDKYWEQRYASGGNSGVGSYNKFAEFKADVLNAFVDRHEVRTVIEFGCGDGSQLSIAKYPSYIGIDVSSTVIDLCKTRFSSDSSKTFKLVKDYDKGTADLSLSLDVIYHLVEDEVFDDYMRALFEAANRYVIIYSSNFENNAEYEGSHVRHREFVKWIQDNRSDWELIEHIPNKYPYEGDYRTGSFADFYIYMKA